jgi:prevent-host-death family protein
MTAESVGLRELRQDASALVRRVQNGDVIVVTVNGRTAARLVPPERGYWRRLDDIDELFDGPSDDRTWDEDVHQFDAMPTDPWTRT